MAPSLFHPLARCNAGYTAIVHQEESAVAGGEGDGVGVAGLAGLAHTLVEWLVVLKGVAEDRGAEQDSGAACRCDKARRISEELAEVGQGLSEAWQTAERGGAWQGGGAAVLARLHTQVSQLAGRLRAEVSILVPGAVGRADPGVAQQARQLLADSEPSAVVGDTLEGVAALVWDLLGVSTCSHCNPTHPADNSTQHMDTQDSEIDSDILSLVAAMCGSGAATPPPIATPPPDHSLGREILERSRKRKQARPSRMPATGGVVEGGAEGGSPVRKIRREAEDSRTEILVLLERRKKGVKKDGLYKFVLWREALKDEKNKLTA